MKADIFGHEQQRNSLSQIVASDRVPPSMMFCGPSGTGKFLIATELAASLLCSAKEYGGCGSCKGCHLAAAGNHPDLHLMNCLDRESSNVEQVRELLYSLALSPFEGACRVVIFNDAEYLSQQAANILLKSLEEPRSGTYFILVTASPSKLPSTVVSRCQVWFFNALSTAEIAAIVSHRQSKGETIPSGVSAAQLARMADGSMDTIDTVAEHIEQWHFICEGLDLVLEGQSSHAVRLANELSKHKQSMRIVLQLLRIRARECMRMPQSREVLRRWALFLSNMVAAERLIMERNLSPSLVLANAILCLVGDRRGMEGLEARSDHSLIENIVVF